MSEHTDAEVISEWEQIVEDGMTKRMRAGRVAPVRLSAEQVDQFDREGARWHRSLRALEPLDA